MAVRVSRRRRRATVLLGAAAVAGALAACSGAGGVDDRTAMRTTEAAPTPSPGTPAETPTPAGRSSPTRAVTCDVHTCTLTLRTTEPREVRAFDTTLSLDRVEAGVASLTAGDAGVECTANESVHAGPLVLFCDDVTAGSVTLTAEVG